jgi:hypothetical protein
MKSIITNWENDLIELPEQMVQSFVNKEYDGFELKILSGLRHRTFEEIWETLKESYAIIMQPSLLDEQQVIELAKAISHGIWGNFHSNVNNLSVRYFHFISMNPFEDLMQIKETLLSVKDQHEESCIAKIVKCVSCNFHGFNGEHYEMSLKGSWPEHIEALRHK